MLVELSSYVLEKDEGHQQYRHPILPITIHGTNIFASQPVGILVHITSPMIVRDRCDESQVVPVKDSVMIFGPSEY